MAAYVIRSIFCLPGGINTMRNRLILAIIAILVVVSAALAGTYISISGKTTILSGVSIAGVNVGGMTFEQAEAELAPAVEKTNRIKVTLKCGGGSAETTVQALGGAADVKSSIDKAMAIGSSGSLFNRISDIIDAVWNGVDIPLNYTLDKNKVSQNLESIAKSLERESVDAKPVEEKGEVRIEPEKVGVKIDLDANIEKLTDAVNSGVTEIEIEFISSDPEIKAADLEGINAVASYSTKYISAQRDRTHNLKIACEGLNGTIIKPGEIFSYNKVVGPRLKKLGFRDAPMFVNGQVEPGTGGGVCQVSTTVYNAALLSNMKIVRRSHHSRPVVYAPVGRDATVAYPQPDLKFENTSNAPVYITASAEKGYVKVNFYYGKPQGQEVALVSSGHKRIPNKKVEIVDETLKPGKKTVVDEGRMGHRISIYRIVKMNGEVVKKELISNNHYRPGDRIVKVPPQPAAQVSAAETPKEPSNGAAAETSPEPAPVSPDN